MLLRTHGRQYSLPELRHILKGAGFTGVEALRTDGGNDSLVSANRAQALLYIARHRN